jgi:hypothetical protein
VTRRIKLFGASAGVLLGLGAMSALAASASVVSLYDDESFAPVGTPSYETVLLTVGRTTCTQTVRGGTLASNGRTPKATFAPSEVSAECSAGSSITGLGQQIQLVGCMGGACEAAPAPVFGLKARPKLALQIPGPCVYELKRFFGRLEATPSKSLEHSGVAVASSRSSAKLNRKRSIAACPKTEVVVIEATLGDNADAEPFEWKYVP